MRIEPLHSHAPASFWKIPLLNCVLRHTVGTLARREVHATGTALSGDARAGLKRYLETHLVTELKRGNDQNVPPEVTFVFGHTHKPFENQDHFRGFPIRITAGRAAQNPPG